ncbi:MAG: methylcrotonoyl-CoA carboxylase, partial [Pseudomonas sp.]
MSVLKTQLHASSPDFAANSKAMRTLVENLQQLLSKIAEGGGATAQERHLSRGKLLPRQRIDSLLDPGSPFLEIGQLAAHGVYGEDVPAA